MDRAQKFQTSVRYFEDGKSINGPTIDAEGGLSCFIVGTVDAKAAHV